MHVLHRNFLVAVRPQVVPDGALISTIETMSCTWTFINIALHYSSVEDDIFTISLWPHFILKTTRPSCKNRASDYTTLHPALNF
ncbi:hypothetical protein PsorP6_002154 [Peronosclerospora sorghi]|uniref:Uncharacterized protein n=1 Tax=Peronosclerospora sorghi TaxID=230839 RepID=A0ACC0WVZ6_9STRA|nr:hypothetical protein PsorP6_002154 [Peronosclerospora sorghi]